MNTKKVAEKLNMFGPKTGLKSQISPSHIEFTQPPKEK